MARLGRRFSNRPGRLASGSELPERPGPHSPAPRRRSPSPHHLPRFPTELSGRLFVAHANWPGALHLSDVLLRREVQNFISKPTYCRSPHLRSGLGEAVLREAVTLVLHSPVTVLAWQKARSAGVANKIIDLPILNIWDWSRFHSTPTRIGTRWAKPKMGTK